MKDISKNLPKEILEQGYLYTLGVFVFGLILLIWGETSILIAWNIAAVLLLILGVLRVVKYFREDGPEEGHEHQVLAQGAVMAVFGVLAMVYFDKLGTLLPLLIAAVILIRSCFRLQAAVDLKRLLWTIWFVPLILAGVMVVCAILILTLDFNLNIVLLIFGILLLIEAAGDLLCRLMYEKLLRMKNAEKKPCEAEE